MTGLLLIRYLAVARREVPRHSPPFVRSGGHLIGFGGPHAAVVQYHDDFETYRVGGRKRLRILPSK